jgi:hypothetical protein
VNIAVLVVLSGREPIIFTWNVPGGLNFETKIVPLVEKTPIRSVAWLRACPSKLSYPV